MPPGWQIADIGGPDVFPLAGDVFYIAPGHDSWVVGEEHYVSVHFLGADAYASAKKG